MSRSKCIEIVKGLCAGGYFEFNGEFYDLPAVKLNPALTQPLPILIGGHSDAGLRRATQHDGFMYAGGEPGELEGIQVKLNAIRSAAGTRSKPFRIFATEMGALTVDPFPRSPRAPISIE